MNIVKYRILWNSSSEWKMLKAFFVTYVDFILYLKQWIHPENIIHPMIINI